MFGKQNTNTCEEEMICQGSNLNLSLTIKENRGSNKKKIINSSRRLINIIFYIVSCCTIFLTPCGCLSAIKYVENSVCDSHRPTNELLSRTIN